MGGSGELGNRHASHIPVGGNERGRLIPGFGFRGSLRWQTMKAARSGRQGRGSGSFRRAESRRTRLQCL